MLTHSPKPRECAQCHSLFSPQRMGAKVCSPRCASRFVRAQNDAKKAEEKQRREKLKTNGKRKAEAQAALNRWIVHFRDVDQPCISCGRFHQGIYHAGHYRSRGSASHLALDPRNLAKQCAPCNLHLHGNLIGFRAGLIARHGVEFVEALESDNECRNPNGADYDALKAEYRALCRKTKAGEKA